MTGLAPATGREHHSEDRQDRAPPSPPVSLRAVKVLLVDDRPDNLLALEAVLDPLGLDLVSVSSGEEALRSLLQDEFAVIVLDVQMPVLDGFETARLVKAREKTRHLPIIFLTAISGEAAHFRLGYATGAVDYVYKPFDPDMLRAKVKVFAELWQRGALIEAQGRELAVKVEELDLAHAALARQADELERSNLALERFAGVVAEEIRDPLHTVAGLLELLVARHGHDLGEEALLLADRAAAGVARTQGVVLSLLDFARASSEGLELGPVELGEVVADAVAAHDPHGSTRFEVSGLPVVKGDRRLLTLLMSALVDSGAASAEIGTRSDAGDPGTPEEDARVVTVTAEPRSGGWVVRVADSGWVTEPGDQARLFTPVTPGPGSTSAQAVSGVNLALCRRVVERHGGAIWAEAGPGGGTAICFTLPE